MTCSWVIQVWLAFLTLQSGVVIVSHSMNAHTCCQVWVVSCNCLFVSLMSYDQHYLIPSDKRLRTHELYIQLVPGVKWKLWHLLVRLLTLRIQECGGIRYTWEVRRGQWQEASQQPLFWGTTRWHEVMSCNIQELFLAYVGPAKCWQSGISDIFNLNITGIWHILHTAHMTGAFTLPARR